MEKKIKIQIMNRTGHKEVEVDFEGAVDLIRKEMGEGKWLKIDARTIITSVEIFNRDLEILKNNILAADELTLIAGLKGGSPTSNQYKFDRFGYDKDGYDADGYNREGYDRDGYDRDGYDKDGYDRDGYDYIGYNKDGYDRDGYDKDGYDIDGYDRDGYDKDGYHKSSYTNHTRHKRNETTAVKITIVKAPESNQVISVDTDGAIIVNNAYGREVMAEAWAKLNLGLAKTMPALLTGKAVVIDKTK